MRGEEQCHNSDRHPDHKRKTQPGARNGIERNLPPPEKVAGPGPDPHIRRVEYEGRGHDGEGKNPLPFRPDRPHYDYARSDADQDEQDAREERERYFVNE